MDAVEDRAGGNHKVLAKKIASSPPPSGMHTMQDLPFPWDVFNFSTKQLTLE